MTVLILQAYLYFIHKKSKVFFTSPTRTSVCPLRDDIALHGESMAWSLTHSICQVLANIIVIIIKINTRAYAPRSHKGVQCGKKMTWSTSVVTPRHPNSMAGSIQRLGLRWSQYLLTDGRKVRPKQGGSTAEPEVITTPNQAAEATYHLHMRRRTQTTPVCSRIDMFAHRSSCLKNPLSACLSIRLTRSPSHFLHEVFSRAQSADAPRLKHILRSNWLRSLKLMSSSEDKKSLRNGLRLGGVMTKS